MFIEVPKLEAGSDSAGESWLVNVMALAWIEPARKNHCHIIVAVEDYTINVFESYSEVKALIEATQKR